VKRVSTRITKSDYKIKLPIFKGTLTKSHNKQNFLKKVALIKNNVFQCSYIIGYTLKQIWVVLSQFWVKYMDKPKRWVKNGI